MVYRNLAIKGRPPQVKDNLNYVAALHGFTKETNYNVFCSMSGMTCVIEENDAKVQYGKRPSIFVGGISHLEFPFSLAKTLPMCKGLEEESSEDQGEKITNKNSGKAITTTINDRIHHLSCTGFCLNDAMALCGMCKQVQEMMRIRRLRRNKVCSY